ncbi:MAG: DUF3971 domain-containing protein [Heliobacteriaceae bacterium]|jgi:hypothetical protein|nr:DUF3971 domain-containing protein [Heliobacteriaceae bacterium]
MGKKIALLTIILLYGFYLWGIPAIVNLHGHTGFVERQVLQKTGFRISMKNPQFATGFLPSIKLRADEFNILNADDSKALYIEKPYIKISLTPLIFGKLNIKAFRANNFVINFVLDKQSNLRMGDYQITEFPKLTAKNVRIDSYKASLNYELRPKPVCLSGEHLNIEGLSDKLNINKMELKGGGIDASVKGEINNFNTKHPRLDLDIAINNLRTENIIPLLPDNDIPEMNFRKLKESGFWGNVKGNLKIRGKADAPDITGEISISDGYLIKPIPKTPKTSINMLFNGDKAILDVIVPVSASEAVFVKGPLELYGEKYADLAITSTKNVNLKTAQSVLNPLHEILKFDLGPVPVMDLAGLGNINLNVKGNREKSSLHGMFNFRNSAASLHGIPNITLENGSGKLIFEDTNIKVDIKTASLNGKPVTITGICSVTGDLDLKIQANGQKLEDLLNIIKTSPLTADIKELPVKSASGLTNLYLNITGKITDFNDIIINKNIFAKGSIELLSDDINLGVSSKVSGKINFDNFNGDFNLAADTGGLKTTVNGKFKDGKINLKGKIHPYEDAVISINSTEFELNNSRFKLSPVNGTFKNSPFYISADINKFLEKNQAINGELRVQKFDLSVLEDKNVKDMLKKWTAADDFKNFKGIIDINAKINNNNISAYTALDNISLFYAPAHLDVKISSGNPALRNDTLNLGKINAYAGGMPVLLDGKISDIYKNPALNIYVNAKPTQEFLDQFFNNTAVYPVKLKGDVNLTSKITGTKNNLNSHSVLKVEEDSLLYYMGATIGDPQYPVKITIDSTYSPDKLRINNFQYDKIISSQNNKPYVTPQLNLSGTLNFLKNNDVGFLNFKVKTQAPTDAKIFNIIFRKPIMKQGIFTSNLTINGTASNPEILGTMEITSIDMPFFDAAVNDINLNFKPDFINIASKGVVLANSVKFNAVARNKLTPPHIIENIKLEMADLNINKITGMMRDYEADSLHSRTSGTGTFDTSQLIIRKAEITAGKVQVRNINADNFAALLSLNEKMVLDVNNFRFNIAKGVVSGDFSYNMLNRAANLKIHLDNADALMMSEALFDLKGQIYGSMTGDARLVCNGTTYETCLQTVSGESSFKVANGKMPKLGSLEYLLKAGNLVRGGFTGLSINSLADLITPLKTGEFESISGDISISKGAADKINIYSKGRDLNMYMSGTYNLVNSVADMEIFGSLSKNITSVFGKVKNASLNTLFNTIPGLSTSDREPLLQNGTDKIPNINQGNIYRIFKVDIYGDINGDNYVQSFRWAK